MLTSGFYHSQSVEFLNGETFEGITYGIHYW